MIVATGISLAALKEKVHLKIVAIEDNNKLVIFKSSDFIKRILQKEFPDCELETV